MSSGTTSTSVAPAPIAASAPVPSSSANGSGIPYIAAQHITPHFQTGEYIPHTSFVKDDVYALLLVYLHHISHYLPRLITFLSIIIMLVIIG
jgi:hypothetical protein